jgi:hypothetical protein
MNSWWTKGTQGDLRSLYRMSGMDPIIAEEISAWSIFPDNSVIGIVEEEIYAELNRRWESTGRRWPAYPFDSERAALALSEGKKCAQHYVHDWDVWLEELRRLGYSVP